MPIRVLSIVRGADAGAARPNDPALDVNAYAVAGDVELTLVLKDHGVELALGGTACHQDTIAGIEVPASVPATDLRALLDSGVSVLAVELDLRSRGLAPEDLLDGIEVVDEPGLAALIATCDVTLSTTS